jgi:hypothetical protein
MERAGVLNVLYTQCIGLNTLLNLNRVLELELWSPNWNRALEKVFFNTVQIYLGPLHYFQIHCEQV